MKSMGHTQNSKKYEAHFASQVPKTGAMDPIAHGAGPSDNKNPPTKEEDSMDIDIDNMLVEYSSNDIFGDLK
jgi:hypothetical protein